jgi:hypothetical protein
MWFITQCFGVGFRGSHRAGDTIKLIKSADFKVEDINADLHKRVADTVEVSSELQAERERLLDPDGTPRD